MQKAIIIVTFLLGFNGFSQLTAPSFIAPNYTEGILLAHRPNMNHLLNKNNRGFQLTALWQKTDTTQMTLLYGKPLIGVNFTFLDFGYKEVLGRGFGLTYVMQFNLLQTKNNWCFEFRTETGIGLVTKYYDKVTNPKNNAIGSILNTKPVLELRATKYLPKLHFGIGAAFSHFSNGAFKNPNLGLNTAYISLNAGYNFTEREIAEKRPNFKERKAMKDPFPDHNLIGELVISGREVSANPADPKLYPVIGTRLTYVYRPRVKWGWDISLDFVYNAANPNLWPEEGHTAADGFQIGIYTGAQAYFYRGAILFGGGYYIVDPANAAGRFYDRLGFQYYFFKRMYGMFAIKANFAKADYFEFGLGYRIKGWGED